jgi:subtilisin family serine protease
MAADDVSRVLVFHKAGAAAASTRGLVASFPKPSSLFADLMSAKKKGLAASYIKQADRVDAPLTYQNLGITLGYADRATMKALSAHPQVSYCAQAPSLGNIRPVRVAEAALTSKTTWGLQSLGVEKLWKEGLTGKGVMVGHLDTGVDASHPALKGRLAEFGEWDMMGHKLEKAKAHDSDQHGTHTAGTICGVSVGGRSVGVAPGAQLCSGLVIEGGDATARILGGLDWLVGLGVRVISLSLGFRGFTPVFQRLVDILVQRNIVPVFAIGNEGPNTSRSPGNYPDSLAIGAVGKDGKAALFSGSQHFSRKQDPNKPDCMAPGVAVISAKPGGGWQEMDGTSMATPHVAGIVALLLQAKPAATATEIRQALLDSAQPLGAEPALRHGRGFIQPAAALSILTGAPVASVGLKTRKRAKTVSKPRPAVKSKRGRKK